MESQPRKRGSNFSDVVEVGAEARVRPPQSKRIGLSVSEVPCSSRQAGRSSTQRMDAGNLMDGCTRASDDTSVIPPHLPNLSRPESNPTQLVTMASGSSTERTYGSSSIGSLDQTPHPFECSSYSMRCEVYKKYDFRSYQIAPRTLPVYNDKKKIEEAVNCNRVVLLTGFTGCGKTTQVPQYIMDSCRVKNELCNIIVTQPRRIAAISMAKRVCFERKWEVGTVVGYQVRKDNQINLSETLISYVTTGVLLQQLVNDKSLRRYTHIIIDEVHERDLDTDYLLLLIKKILMEDYESREANTKIILMSATINYEKFVEYFTFNCGDNASVIPKVVRILPSVSFRIVDEYLDDVLKDNKNLLNFIDNGFIKENPCISTEVYNTAVQTIINLDEVVMPNERDPRRQIPYVKRTEEGAVLVFLPGREEIRNMQKLLNNAEMEFKKKNGSYKWLVLPLHSSVTLEEQKQVFKEPPAGFRKIILSTNIAESSITVEDIVVVLDFCLTRCSFVDPATNLDTLKLVWAAKAQCIQRRGRAGRVKSGKCIKMVTRRCYREYLDNEIKPEMNRCNLENVILWCKLFSPESPMRTLDYALDKPEAAAIERTVSSLKRVGALTIARIDINGIEIYDPCDGDLTFMGKVMSFLPVSLNYARLILFGRCFGVIDQAIIIAAASTVKNPFRNFENPLDSYTRTCEFSRSSYSDLIAVLNLYQKWFYTFVSTKPKDQRLEKKWANDLNVSLWSLWEIKSIVDEIRNRLNQLLIRNNYYVAGVPGDPTELSAEQGLFIKLSIAGAFYPNYFIRRKPLNPTHYNEQVCNETNQFDPFRTVIFRGFRPENEGRLYAKRIADYLSNGEHTPAIIFDNSRVLAVFDQSLIDTGASFGGTIFRAIKLRTLPNNRLTFPVFTLRNDDEAALKVWDEKVRSRVGFVCPPLRELPSVVISSVDVNVTNIISPSKFWVTLKLDEAKFQRIAETIRNSNRLIFLPEIKLFPNGFCLAMMEEKYCRGKILRLRDSETPSIKEVLIFFVDTGHTKWIRSSTLLDFSPEMIEAKIHELPCLAIQCRLVKIKPNDALGVQWCHEAVTFMKNFCRIRRNGDPILHFKIFCIYESVMIGDIIGESLHSREQSSLRQLLMSTHHDEAHAVGKVAIERYLVLENFRQRERFINQYNSNGRYEMDRVNDCNENERGVPLDFDFPDPPEKSQTTCLLRGPFSPLEITFEAISNCIREKETKIENGSVNSVALDHDPSDSVSRMLVAAQVGLTDKDKTVRVSDTTIMPSVPGYASFSCLLFAPKVELRVDKTRSKYTGVLCGCGTAILDDKVVTVNGDYDVENTFEVKVDDQDINLINNMRHQLSSILMTPSNVEDIQKQLRTSSIKLLKQKRDMNYDEIWPAVPFLWNLTASEHFQPMEPASYYHARTDILSPIQRIILVENEDDDIVWDLAY